MANVIIPRAHQSAPKQQSAQEAYERATDAGFRVRDFRRFAGALDDLPAISRTIPRDEAYEHEMELPAARRPEVQRGVAEFMARGRQRSPEEYIEQALLQFEKNYSSPDTKAQRWAGQGRWQGRQNEEARMVRIYHPHRFIQMLDRAGVRASIQWQPAARLWLNQFSARGRIGVNAWCGRQRKTLTTLQYPYGPEWSVMRFDRWNVPTAEKYRGWRTALLALVVAGALTEAEAERAFGAGQGAASEFYRQQLFDHRNKVGNQLIA